MSQLIKCPECGNRFQQNDATARQIEKRLRKQIEGEQARFLERERAALEKSTLKKVSEQFAIELSYLRDSLEEKNRALQESNRQELSLRKRQRVLEEKEAAIQLEVERVLDAERKKLSVRINEQANEIAQQKVAEKDRLITELKSTIDSMHRKTHQISEKVQGTAAEDILESTLSTLYPDDEWVRVRNGAKGGDLVQKIRSGNHIVATILYESKKTKNWQSSWISKVKSDQSEIKADLAVIVSDVLPEEIHGFGKVEGVVLSNLSSVCGLVSVLRSSMIDISRVRRSSENSQERGEILLRYLSSGPFREGVTRIIETFRRMQETLQKEKSASTRLFAEREAQISSVVGSVAQIVGDLQGSANVLPDLEVLQITGAQQ
ncbi:MAG: DUF2130 domain-containing protein [Leptospirales bacterium]|nr:DUF2130 domain-containing protein [Leptospirales bacterium]